MRAPSRDPTPPWFRPVQDRLSPTITALVVVYALLFALYAVVKQSRMFIETHLALGPAALLGRPVPGAVAGRHLAVRPPGPWSFFFNVLGLWFVGATIERQLGRSRFLMLFLVPAVLGNLVMAGMMFLTRRGELFAGSGLAVLALFVAFGRIYDRTPARILGGLVLEARTLTLILVALRAAGGPAARFDGRPGRRRRRPDRRLRAVGRARCGAARAVHEVRPAVQAPLRCGRGGRPSSKEERRSRYLN